MASGGGESDSDDTMSQSWPDTDMGLPEQPPESPPLPTRRTFSHYTQVGEQLMRQLCVCWCRVSLLLLWQRL